MPEATTPTVREFVEASNRVTRSKNELASAELAMQTLSRFSPIEIAFAEGRAAATMRTNPDGHWEKFVEQFGEVEGARDQFDAGRASVADQLSDRQMLMRAIRYLAQTAEKLNEAAANGGVHPREVAQTCQRICDEIEHLCQDDDEDMDLDFRMKQIARSLDFLAHVRRQFDTVLSLHGLWVPNGAQIAALAAGQADAA